MEISQIDRKKLEKFYTKKSVVVMCMEHVKLTIDELKITKPHLLEPAAGAGAFVDEFATIDAKYTAYDIQPEAKTIKKADFLNNDIPTYKNLVVVGNPPYKLAIKFINKCATLNALLICFVLPNVFKKPTIVNKINKNYHVLKKIQLPKNSFKLGTDNYDVPSSFFIFIKKQTMRPLMNLVVPCVGYKYISFNKLIITNNVINGADISVIRVGGRAGKAFLTTDISDDALVSKQKYNYFIKFDNKKNHLKIITEINKIKWDKNNTTGPRSIAKYELNPVLNMVLTQDLIV
jgi:hypothetical protein